MPVEEQLVLELEAAARADGAPASNAPGPRRARRPAAVAPRSTASELAKKQREISVSEFFAKNRHLLGFDNPTKALLTTVKEAVDNALDACEEAGIVPELRVEIVQLAETRFRVAVEDNGPGIVRAQVPKVFGRLLYGSKFHRLRQSRGQQGIGISAAGMYGLLTTGKPVVIVTKTDPKKKAHHLELVIDTQKNEPRVTRDDEIAWDKPHGTRVEIELEAAYRGGRQGVDAYLEQVSLANPHAEIVYLRPKGTDGDAERRFPRVAHELPPPTAEIQPHPYGVELGVLMQMFRDTKARNLKGCLTTDFSRVSGRIADEICQRAKVAGSRRPSEMTREEAERVHAAIQATKIMAPPTDCIAPIGETLIERALRAEVKSEFVAAVTRRPEVYRGNPFLVEVGLAYGGDLPADEPVTLFRYANRVPLQYQQGACAITKAVMGTDWKAYHLQQPKGALPIGPMLLMVHIASVWVPFTSESKEAIASLSRDPQGDPSRPPGVRAEGLPLHQQAAARSRRGEEARLHRQVHPAGGARPAADPRLRRRREGAGRREPEGRARAQPEALMAAKKKTPKKVANRKCRQGRRSLHATRRSTRRRCA